MFKYKVIETIETTVEFYSDIEPTQEEILAEAAEGTGQCVDFEIVCLINKLSNQGDQQ